MNVGGHVQRPFHVFLSTKVLHQHRNVKQHVEVIVEVRSEVIQGVGRCLHSPVFDVFHGADNFLVDLRRTPRLGFGPRPNPLILCRGSGLGLGDGRGGDLWEHLVLWKAWQVGR